MVVVIVQTPPQQQHYKITIGYHHHLRTAAAVCICCYFFAVAFFSRVFCYFFLFYCTVHSITFFQWKQFVFHYHHFSAIFAALFSVLLLLSGHLANLHCSVYRRLVTAK